MNKEHDPLCPQLDCDYPDGECDGYDGCLHSCQCSLISNIRFEEREKAAQRVEAALDEWGSHRIPDPKDYHAEYGDGFIDGMNAAIAAARARADERQKVINSIEDIKWSMALSGRPVDTPLDESDDFYAWIQKGLDKKWAAASCCTHEGPAMTEEEDNEFTEGYDPCIPILRVYEPDPNKTQNT